MRGQAVAGQAVCWQQAGLAAACQSLGTSAGTRKVGAQTGNPKPGKMWSFAFKQLVGWRKEKWASVPSPLFSKNRNLVTNFLCQAKVLQKYKELRQPCPSTGASMGKAQPRFRGVSIRLWLRLPEKHWKLCKWSVLVGVFTGTYTLKVENVSIRWNISASYPGAGTGYAGMHFCESNWPLSNNY